MKYCLDADSCIFFLKGLSLNLCECLQGMAPDRVKIPSVVMAELLVGVEKSENPREKAKEINQFLNPYEIIPFGAEAAVFYSKIRADLEERGLPMGPNDLMIAATVMAHDGILVTHNVKEFRRVRHLVIEDWVE